MLHIQMLDATTHLPVPNSERHLPPEIAKSFILSGLAILLPPKRESCLEAQLTRCPKASEGTTPDTQWSVRPAATINDMRYPPQIFAKCTACGISFFASNPRKTISTPFRHAASCRFVTEWAPDDVVKEYEEQRNAFYPPKTFVAVVEDKLAEVRSTLKGVAR